MTETILQAEARTPGQTASKALRRNGRVPGVFYSRNHEPIHFSVPALSLRSIVYTAEAKMVKLSVDGGQALDCVLKDVTFDPITDKLLHFDLLGVAVGEMILVDIPIHLIGQSVGVRDGGILEHVMHKVRVKADPHVMPEHVDIDVTNLKVGDAIHISDLKIEGCELLDRPDAVIVACQQPRTIADAAVAGDATATAASTAAPKAD
ncbi:MAG: 50S ribosomal protein L25 [bacterium]|nr:50S ribosomal protein L25 [bacterium]